MRRIDILKYLSPPFIVRTYSAIIEWEFNLYYNGNVVSCSFLIENRSNFNRFYRHCNQEEKIFFNFKYQRKRKDTFVFLFLCNDIFSVIVIVTFIRTNVRSNSVNWPNLEI